MSVSKDKVIVEAIWQVNDKSSYKIRALSREVRLLGAYASNTRMVLWNMGAVAVPAILAAGMVKLTKSVIQENQELENMRFTLGAMLYQAQGVGYITGKFKDLNDAMKESNKIYDDLYKHSIRAIGTVDDYVNAFRDIHRPVLQAGGTIAQAQEISKLAVPLAQQFMPQDVQAGYRDIRQYLMGQMTQRDVLTRMLGLPEAEISNKLRSEERLALLVRALETGRDAMKAQGGTFNAILDTFKGSIQQLQRVGGLELFETMKADMDAINQEVQNNNLAVMSQAKTIGSELTRAYTMFKDAVVWSVKHFQDIKKTTEYILRAWLTMKAAQITGDLIKGVSDLAESFKKFGGVAALSSKGIGDLTKGILGLRGAVTLAAASVYSAAQIWWKIINMFSENGKIHKEAYKENELSIEQMIKKGEAMGITPSLDRWKQMQAQAKDAAERRFALEYGEIRNQHMWRRSRNVRLPELMQEEEARILQEYYQEFRQSRFEYAPDAEEKKPPPPPDFRGSHITIMVDSRHSDPNRVAATVVNELSRMARARTGTNAQIPSVGSGR